MAVARAMSCTGGPSSERLVGCVVVAAGVARRAVGVGRVTVLFGCEGEAAAVTVNGISR